MTILFLSLAILFTIIALIYIIGEFTETVCKVITTKIYNFNYIPAAIELLIAGTFWVMFYISSY